MVSPLAHIDEKALIVGDGAQRLPLWTFSETTKSRAYDSLCVALNTLATVLIVFLNKYTLADPQLHKAQVLIAIWHFAATFLVLIAATHRRWRLFVPVRLPVLKIFPLAAFFAGFLILNNLSLAHNPVGFYQLSKILTTPCVVLINFVLFRKTISQDKLLAISVTCVGVALVSVQAFRSNLVGTAIAVAAFTVTACYQIWIGKKIVELEVDAPQLLLNQSAMAVWLLLPVSLTVDTLPNVARVPPRTLVVLVTGGVIASLLNLSQFLIIGRTSALTFNIVSNVKMVLILALGWYSEGKHFTSIDVLGIVLAIAGAWHYAIQCNKRPVGERPVR